MPGSVLFGFLLFAAFVVKVLTAQEFGNSTSPVIGIVLAAVLVLLLLPGLPRVRLGPVTPRFVTAVGLLWFGWFVTVAAYGVFGYVFVISGNDWKFNVVLAAAMFVMVLARLVMTAGLALGGVRVTWPWQVVARESTFLRTRTDTVLIALAGFAGAAVLAGYGPFFAQLGWFLVSWLPIHLYRVLLAWWHAGWAALLVDILLFPVWLYVFNLVGMLVELVAGLLSRRIRLKASLTAPMPLWIRRLPEGTYARLKIWEFEYGEWLGTSFPGQERIRKPTRAERKAAEARAREIEELRSRERPLTTRELGFVRHNVGRAAAERVEPVTPDWSKITVVYRAAGPHEEVSIVVAGRDGAETTEDVRDFAELATLRRLRESGYRAGHGTAFAWQLRLTRAYSSHRYGLTGRWREMVWEAVPGDVEPAWRTPPTAADYRADLRRYPWLESELPPWLRAVAAGGTTEP